MTKYRKKSIFQHIIVNRQPFGFDAITFVESMIILEVTLTVCYNLGFLRFFFQQLWSVQNFGEKIFILDHFEF